MFGKFKYQHQLEQLEKLGYTDTKHIKNKLKTYEGDANRVIDDYHKRERNLREHAESLSMSLNSPRLYRVVSIEQSQPLSPIHQTSPIKHPTHVHNNNGNNRSAFPYRHITNKHRIYNHLDESKTNNNTDNENDIETMLSPQTQSTTAALDIPLYSINKPYVSMSSIQTPQSLELHQSMTKLSHTPPLNQYTISQRALYEDVDDDMKTDDDIKTDDDDDDKPHTRLLMKRSASALQHQSQSAICSSTTHLFHDDKWCNHVDSVLRENIMDLLDDNKGIKNMKSLYVLMDAKKPETKMRIQRIYNEIKWVRTGIDEDKEDDVMIQHNNDEDKEELFMEHSKNDNNNDNNNNNDTNDDEKSTQYWINTAEYKKLKELSQQIMRQCFMKCNNEYKTKKDIGDEACNEACRSIFKCVCMHRMEAVLMIYHRLKSSKLWRRVPIAPLICFQDIYGYQQMLEDFQHLQIMHANIDRKGFQQLCTKFEKQYPCDIANCLIFARHYRDRTKVEESKNLYYYNKAETNKTITIQNDKDMVFQQHCDKIHSYLLHSMLKFGPEGEQFERIDAIKRRNELNKYAAGRSFSVNQNDIKRKKKSEQHIMQRSSQILRDKIDEVVQDIKEDDMSESESFRPIDDDDDDEYKLYPGIEEDEIWVEAIEPIVNDVDTRDGEIYTLLVEHMGIFRWQALHGFHYNQYRATNMLRPSFNNIKEEVLYNDFHRITTENWNQTLRKAKAFHQSWAAKKIRTKENGEYHDYISNTWVRWKKDQEISLKEVITLKLYTDFDQLQFELKKCFRFEQFASLIDDNNDMNMKTKDEIAKRILEHRLMDFYHWRMSLQITLKKFGKAIQDMDLYHGVNEKMILYPHATTSAFHGPLSTTASFHVAKTFATDKGMVLKISSMYPRLYHCRAFDASLLSDYPEEHEWLVGFIYTRIRKVHTKEKWNIVTLPTPTQLRFSFFVIHLFKLGLLSLSEDLAELLSFMLNMYLANENWTADENWTNDYSKFWTKKMKKYYAEKEGENANKEYQWRMNGDKKRDCRIMSVLINKFRSFAAKQTIVRFDDISYDLREYFMNKIAQSIETGRNVYRVSFKKIQKIFVNVHEIYLHNYYKLDDELLDHIIEFLGMNDNKNEIKQIKLLYYDYKGDIDCTEFYYPTSALNKAKIDKLASFGWVIIEKHHKKRNTNLIYGVSIRLKNLKYTRK